MEPISNRENSGESNIINEFDSLYEEFHESTSRATCEKVIAFLKDKQKIREFIEYARFDRHPDTHQEIQNDIEATITSLESWLHDRVDSDIPAEFLEDLKNWIK